MIRKRLSLSAAEKLQLVLSSFQSDLVITEFCKEHGVPRSTFYRWRKLVLDGLSALFSVNKRRPHSKKTTHTRKQSVTRKHLLYRCRVK